MTQANIHAKPVNILLVDDDDVDAMGISRAARKLNITNSVLRARDGVEALAMLREEGLIERPYLLLLDINMPRMNGFELLSELREDPNLADSVVFVLTTSKAAQDIFEAYRHNVAGYLIKGRTGEGFAGVIDMLDRYSQNVEFPSTPKKTESFAVETPGLSILLIDDDDLDRKAIVRALRRSATRCAITEATTAAEGLRIAAEQRFDAILLDYRLPDRDGLDVLRSLRSGAFAESAVLMLSRQTDELLAEQCLEAGAQDFLLKDEVNGQRLSRAVRHARQRYLMESQLRHSREELRALSEHDVLTGLRNRRGFEVVLQAALGRAQRGQERLAILLLDLDDFKSINDTQGHAAGDLLLIEIGKRLSEIVREGDHLCRLGGDEFVVLMTQLEQDEQAMLLADRILNAIQKPIQVGAAEQLITASIGIATLESSTDHGDELLKHADLAMYRAKQEGRNKSRFYSTALHDFAQQRAALKQDLKHALGRGEFRVFYQPQLEGHSGRLKGMEALVRWQHPELGLLAPGAFLAVAEETGMIVAVGEWVLRESCRQLQIWRAAWPQSYRDLSLAVNLSAVQLQSVNLLSSVVSALADFQLPAECLELEITESMLIAEHPVTVTMLNAIAEQGVALSLDDFGTGYSSMDHINRFPISIIKIDRRFVASVGGKAKSQQLLVALISFAKAQSIKVVAEGVETLQQADFCRTHGCDLLQGYLFSPPIPADDFEARFLHLPN